MPTISEFFGIVIRMYFEEHGEPHFHAYYGEHGATINIETLRFIEGELPRRAKAMVLEWVQEHRDELMENWKLAREHKPLNNIQPLE